MFPFKSEAVGRWWFMPDALLTWCAVLPCCPSQPSSPICSLGLRAKCQPALMHTQRTMGTQRRDWQGTGRWSHCQGRQFLIWQAPWEKGQTITMATLSPPWSPSPPTTTSVSEELAEVKWENWRLSRDDNFHFKVDGIKLFPFHVATGERRGEVTLLF